VGPFPDSNYAYYSDKDVMIRPTTEELFSRVISIPKDARKLVLEYDYKFFNYPAGRKYKVRMLYHNTKGNRWIDLKTYITSCYGREVIDLSYFLPLDSLKFSWLVVDSSNGYGYTFCSIDSVLTLQRTPRSRLSSLFN